MRFHYPMQVRFRDLDALGYVHHTAALFYVEEARAEYWREVAGRATVADIDYLIGEISIRYHRRIEYPGTVDVALEVARIGTRSFDIRFEIRDAGGELLVSGLVTQVMFDYRAGRSIPMDDQSRERIQAYEGGQKTRLMVAESRPMTAPRT